MAPPGHPGPSPHLKASFLLHPSSPFAKERAQSQVPGIRMGRLGAVSCRPWSCRERLLWTFGTCSWMSRGLAHRARPPCGGCSCWGGCRGWTGWDSTWSTRPVLAWHKDPSLQDSPRTMRFPFPFNRQGKCISESVPSLLWRLSWAHTRQSRPRPCSFLLPVKQETQVGT